MAIMVKFKEKNKVLVKVPSLNVYMFKLEEQTKCRNTFPMVCTEWVNNWRKQENQ